MTFDNTIHHIGLACGSHRTAVYALSPQVEAKASKRSTKRGVPERVEGVAQIISDPSVTIVRHNGLGIGQALSHLAEMLA